MTTWGIHYRGGIVPGPGDYGPPDEPDWAECEDCKGTGKDRRGWECKTCAGVGLLDEEGQPVKEEA